jgi:hypothetical protein
MINNGCGNRHNNNVPYNIYSFYRTFVFFDSYLTAETLQKDGGQALQKDGGQALQKDGGKT